MQKIIKQIEEEISNAPSNKAETLQNQYADIYNKCMNEFQSFLQMIKNLEQQSWEN